MAQKKLRKLFRLPSLQQVLVTGFIAVIVATPLKTTADELGRLFTTKRERAILDKVRREGLPVQEEVVEKPAPVAVPEPEPPPAIPAITVNGFVKRSDGSNTVWVNGANSVVGDFDSQNIRVEPRGIRGQRVPVIVSDRPVRYLEMKPGQTFDPSSAQVVDVYHERMQPQGTTP